MQWPTGWPFWEASCWHRVGVLLDTRCMPHGQQASGALRHVAGCGSHTQFPHPLTPSTHAPASVMHHDMLSTPSTLVHSLYVTPL